MPASSSTAQMATLSKLVAAAKAKGIALPPGAEMAAGMGGAGAPGAAGSSIQITSVAEGQAVLAKLQAALVASKQGGGAGAGAAPDLAALLAASGIDADNDSGPKLGGGSDKDKLLALLSAAAKQRGGDDEDVDEDADGGGGLSGRSLPRAAETKAGTNTIDDANAFLDAGVPDELPGIVDNSGGASKDHVVARGESLKTIADTYGTTMEKLARVNGIEDYDDIQPGVYLQVPNYA